MMRCYGADVRLAPQVEGTYGNVTLADVDKALEIAQEVIASTPDIFYVDQFNNTNNCRAHEETTGSEILKQTGGRVDAFVATLGTGGSFVGVSKHLKSVDSDIKCFVAEPEGCEVIAGKEVKKLCKIIHFYKFRINIYR